MTEASAGASDALGARTDDGTLYVVIGLGSALVAWFLLAIAGGREHLLRIQTPH